MYNLSLYEKNYSLKDIESMIEETHIGIFELGKAVPGEQYISATDYLYLKSKYNVSFMNGLIYFNDSDLNSLESNIETIVADLKAHGNDFVWRILPNNQYPELIEEILVRNGLELAGFSQTAYTHLRVEMLNSFKFEDKLQFKVVDSSNFDDWFHVFSDAFDISNEFSSYFTKIEEAFFGSAKAPYKSYLGYKLGDPVSCVSIVDVGTPLAGLINIGSIKTQRGKSYGMQAAHFGANELLKDGKEFVGQFASEDGVRSYSKLGALLGNKYKRYIWRRDES